MQVKEINIILKENELYKILKPHLVLQIKQVKKQRNDFC